MIRNIRYPILLGMLLLPSCGSDAEAISGNPNGSAGAAGTGAAGTGTAGTGTAGTGTAGTGTAGTGTAGTGTAGTGTAGTGAAGTGTAGTGAAGTGGSNAGGTETIAPIPGPVSHLAVSHDTVYFAVDSKIHVVHPGQSPKLRFDAGSPIAALAGGEKAVYFVTGSTGFELEDTATEAREMINASKTVQDIGFDGESLLCGVGVSMDGHSYGQPSYGHTLFCGTLQGDQEKGSISSGFTSGALVGRIGTTFTDTDVMYSVGGGIHRVSKADISEWWDPDLHRLTWNSTFRIGPITNDGTSIYWVNESNQDWSLKALLLANKSVNDLVSMPTALQLPTHGIFVHGGSIYWAISTGIWRISVSGGDPEQHASASFMTAVASGGGYLYYADQGIGEVRRIAL